ncbi:MAG: PAS domain-containing sensor histidine kinase [Clostridiales bacterium]|nr:PAS domain-containing sensor histidine kinase [Clostridiales bacterium]
MKAIQNKLVVSILSIGIIIISTIGYIYINRISNIQNIEEIVNYTKKYLFIAIFIFIICVILLQVICYRILKKSIVKMVRRAGKIVLGNESEVNLLKYKNRPTNDLMNVFDDATLEIKEHLKDVDKQKKQIETILLYMTDGVIAFDLEGQVTHKNLAAERLLNLQGEDDNFEKIFSKLDVDINLEKIIYLEDWTSSDKKIHIDDKYINLLFVPYKDNMKKVAGVITVIQDITEQVKLDNMRKEFVADVSHELKTPITSIMGYADTLLEGEYDDVTRNKFLNVIASEARRMAKLVTDLLTLSRYDTNKIKIEKTEFDLGELVKKCQEKLEIEIVKKHHKVENLVTANVPLVYADKSGIERVVLNILSNSIKYTKENGSIKIYVGFVYNDAYIKIIDNGYGIPEEDLTRIFERFYRVDKARSRELGGTGLGLSIAREILNQNNGSIDIKSEVGKGTEVVIRVPTRK